MNLSKLSPSLFRELLLALVVLAIAYGGGYYFGRHPSTSLELEGSQSIVIATTLPQLISEELQGWLEDHWGHSIIVQQWSEENLPLKLSDCDLLIVPRSVLTSLQEKLSPRPKNIVLDQIEPDFLNGGNFSIPVLWNLLPLDLDRFRLYQLHLAWTPRASHSSSAAGAGNSAVNAESINGLVGWILSKEFQKMWSEKLDLRPVHRELQPPQPSGTNEVQRIPTKERRLRDIPLNQLLVE